MNRRLFLLGLSSLLMAPAIVRAQSLMPVRPLLWSVPVRSLDGTGSVEYHDSRERLRPGTYVELRPDGLVQRLCDWELPVIGSVL